MTRFMYDGTHVNVQAIREHASKNALIAWYGTGSPDIQWTSQDIADFDGHVMVEIDQKFTGSPVPAATVRDVENGAWTVADAVNTQDWTAERRTIYCSQDTVPEVIEHGWKGDLWLAMPGWAGTEPPKVTGCTVVAVQNQVTASYDTSIVFDPDWPNLAPKVPDDAAFSLTVYSRNADLMFSSHPAADHYVMQYLSHVGAAPVPVGRVKQVAGEVVLHVHGVTIPQASGGILQVYAIVDGNPVITGQRNLP